MRRFFPTPALLIMGVFFMQAVVVSSLYPRMPDIQARLAVGPRDLAIGLLGLPIASLCALLISGALVERITPRRTILLAFCFYCAASALPGFAWNVPSLFLALFLVGIGYPLVDVAMNVEANRIEGVIGRRIMSTCHGFWSIGQMAGFLVGVGFAWMGVEVQWQMVIVSAASTPFALLIPKLPDAPAARAETTARGSISLPSLGMLGVCFFTFGLIMVEIANKNWSAIFFHDVFGSSTAVAGIGAFAFAAAMALGRFFGDWLTNRLGPVLLARLCTAMALAGIAVFVSGINLEIAILGLAAAGLGVSVAFPLAITAVASRGDRPAPVNVSAFQLFTAISALLVPLIIGSVAEGQGLRVGLAILLPPLVLSLVLTGELSRSGAPNREKIAEAGADR
jgi:MFS family permease